MFTEGAQARPGCGPGLRMIRAMEVSAELQRYRQDVMKDIEYDVSPDWARQAVVMTSTAVEVSLEHLRDLYLSQVDSGHCETNHRFKTNLSSRQPKPGNSKDHTKSVTITLRHKFSGRSGWGTPHLCRFQPQSSTLRV